MRRFRIWLETIEDFGEPGQPGIYIKLQNQPVSGILSIIGPFKTDDDAIDCLSKLPIRLTADAIVDLTEEDINHFIDHRYDAESLGFKSIYIIKPSQAGFLFRKTSEKQSVTSVKSQNYEKLQNKEKDELPPLMGERRAVQLTYLHPGEVVLSSPVTGFRKSFKVPVNKQPDEDWYQAETRANNAARDMALKWADENNVKVGTF